MFTGLVEYVGRVAECARESSGTLFRIEAPFPGALDLGSSVSVQGACHTVVESGPGWFRARSMAETLARTTLGDLAEGSRVNLERSLRLGAELGGHLVSGHVDGVGRIARMDAQPTQTLLSVELPEGLARFVAEKGSLCVDGVSLTVGEVSRNTANLYLIPHTLEATVAGEYLEGGRVNLEVDLIARYLARLAEFKA